MSSKFRAFDKKTGETLVGFRSAGEVVAAPITYLLDGKQYIVVAVGGGDQPDEFVAFTLP